MTEAYTVESVLNSLSSVARAALLALLALSVPAIHAAPAKKSVPGKPAPAKLTEIELTHQLGADAGAQLAALIERYNATKPAVKVTLTQRDWRSGHLPEMLILKEADEARLLSGKPGAKPVHQIMQEAGLPLETLRPPPTMTPHPLDGQNRLVGLPLALATPVMYFNRDAARRAGLDVDNPPRTWQALQDWLGKFYDKGITCPYTTSQPVWVHLENTSAWHNEPVGNGTLNLNGLLQVKHLALMSSWYKSRYLHIFGRDDEADAHFVKGECAVLTSASSAYPGFLRNARFEVGVAPLPYHEEYFGAPQNTLSDGPALWVVAGKSAEEYRAVAAFVNFLLSAESQVELQRNLGGLPVNRAGLYAARGGLLKDDLASVRVAIATLTNKPATDVSRASLVVRRPEVRQILDEALESLWANQKPAKQALDDAVVRARRVLARR